MAEYHVENFGCRASRADGEAIAAGLEARGIAPAAPSAAAVIVVNTCSVTEEADRSARAFLRRIERDNPSARIVVTGCYAQRAAQEIAALPGVDQVIGNSHKRLVPDIAAALVASQELPPLSTQAASPHEVSPLCESSRRTPAAAISDAALEPAGFSHVEPAHSKFTPPDFVPLAAITAKPHAGILVDSAFAHTDLAVLDFSVLHASDLTFSTSDFATPQPARTSHQTRPNLKAQDGCSNRCSFCVIPETRGPSRSTRLEDCLRAVEAFTAAGGQELVLSGINLGRWGRDLVPRLRFEDLVAALLENTTLPRLRISSVEPMDWSPELLSLYRRFAQDVAADTLRNAPGAPIVPGLPAGPDGAPHSGPRLARHAHLPLQSGSDAILRRMHRRYRPWHYAERLGAIRATLPDAAIGADVLVGFPGESDAHFRETFDFVAAQPLTYLHLFPFSPRPGTPAWDLHRQMPVPQQAVRERMTALRALARDKHRTFRAGFLGRELPVITLQNGTLNNEADRTFRARHHAAESHGENPATTPALSDNFLRVELYGAYPANLSLRARVHALTPDGLAAAAISNPRGPGAS